LSIEDLRASEFQFGRLLLERFTSNGALLAAMVDALFQSILEAVPERGTPRERIETQMLTSPGRSLLTPRSRRLWP